MWKFVGRVLVFTLIEVGTLAYWLARRAVGVLYVGLLVEHVVQGLVKRGAPISLGEAIREVRERGVGIAVFTLAEWAIWIAAALLIGQPILAFVFLFASLVVKHSLAENVFADRPVFSRLLVRSTIVPSAIEAFGGTVWLANPSLLTVAVLSVTSFVEHYLLSRRRNGVNVIRRIPFPGEYGGTHRG